jgi:hypothetical protein
MRGQFYARKLFASVTLLAFLLTARDVVGAKTTFFGQAPERSDFSGIWTLDEDRSGPPREVWFISRAGKFTISQLGSELKLDADASIADVEGPLTYRLDGSEITTINHSAGDIAGWTRKIRTKAMMDRTTLVLHTSHLSETTDRATGNTHENVAVTIVLIFRLLPNGREMTVERTGFRPVPPQTHICPD